MLVQLLEVDRVVRFVGSVHKYTTPAPELRDVLEATGEPHIHNVVLGALRCEVSTHSVLDEESLTVALEAEALGQPLWQPELERI